MASTTEQRPAASTPEERRRPERLPWRLGWLQTVALIATKADYSRLAGEQGLPADIDLSELMIRHHEAGIEMADFAARNGSNEAVRELARKMARTQRFEIREMNLRRRVLGVHALHPSGLIPTHG